VDDLLEQPAVRAVRVIALALLDTLVAKREGLSPDAPEALHDFRVALRRLRSHLRAYRATLRGSVRRKTRRWLAELADATNASRDAEVHIGWLEEQRSGVSPRQRVGLDWLVERLAARKRDSDAALAAMLASEFDDRSRALSVRLETFEIRLHVRGAIVPTPLAEEAAALVESHAATLRDRLAAVAHAKDVGSAHAARIAGKRLRYLIEPIAGAQAIGPALIAALKSLQDTLGDLHDAHVFADRIAEFARAATEEDAERLAKAVRRGKGERGSASRARRDPRPGLLELGERLRVRGERAFDAFAAGWRGEAVKEFFEQVDLFVRSLSERAEAATRHDVEIERKYLLSALPERVRDATAYEIEQGYLPGRHLIERVRRVASGTDERFYRTVKLGQGLARTEIEEEATLREFQAMWPLTDGRRIRKRRYVVEEPQQVWEIDEFLDRELVLAEVELAEAKSEMEPPKWLSPLIVREVTDEAAYVNVNLAR
jgi:CHAD domain-containing protein/CYTH domain-containing protein